MELRDIDDWWDGPGIYWISNGLEVRNLGYCDHILRLAEAVCALRDSGFCIDDAIIGRSRVRTVQES